MTFADILREAFTGSDAEFEGLIHPDAVVWASTQANLDGQVRLVENKNTKTEMRNLDIVAKGMTAFEILSQATSRSELIRSVDVGSIFIDCQFKNLYGENSSAISIYKTSMILK